MAVEVTREGAVAVVTVNRPEALNALNTETNEALLAAVRELSAGRRACAPSCSPAAATSRSSPAPTSPR